MKIATKAIIINRGKYLLQHRDNKKSIYSPNCWGLFGGMANKNETPEGCIKREVNYQASCLQQRRITICLSVR